MEQRSLGTRPVPQHTDREEEAAPLGDVPQIHSELHEDRCPGLLGQGTQGGEAGRVDGARGRRVRSMRSAAAGSLRRVSTNTDTTEVEQRAV